MFPSHEKSQCGSYKLLRKVFIAQYSFWIVFVLLALITTQDALIPGYDHFIGQDFVCELVGNTTDSFSKDPDSQVELQNLLTNLLFKRTSQFTYVFVIIALATGWTIFFNDSGLHDYGVSGAAIAMHSVLLLTLMLYIYYFFASYSSFVTVFLTWCALQVSAQVALAAIKNGRTRRIFEMNDGYM